jgi:predicted RNA methylase
MFITCWADEYDSDMEQNDKLTNNNSNSNSNSNLNKVSQFKFSEKIQNYKCSINYRLFNIVENSEYSCLLPWFVNQVNFCLKEFYNYEYLKNNGIFKIIDCGANVGIDSINFLSNFPKSQLIAFEIDNTTYNCLCKNFLEFKNITNLNSITELTNYNNKVQAYNMDFTSNMNIIKDADIVFIDAPWGGKIYKDKKNVSIYLQHENDYYKIHNYNETKNIINISKKILQSDLNVKSIILKVPYNYEFSKLENEILNLNLNKNIVYRNIYKGNSNYISFVLVFIY